MQHVEPMFAPLVAKIGFTLRDFVGVVWKCVVDTTAVDIKILARVFYRNRRALDVPTWVTDTPRAIPL